MQKGVPGNTEFMIQTDKTEQTQEKLNATFIFLLWKLEPWERDSSRSDAASVRAAWVESLFPRHWDNTYFIRQETFKILWVAQNPHRKRKFEEELTFFLSDLQSKSKRSIKKLLRKLS